MKYLSNKNTLATISVLLAIFIYGCDHDNIDKGKSSIKKKSAKPASKKRETIKQAKLARTIPTLFKMIGHGSDFEQKTAIDDLYKRYNSASKPYIKENWFETCMKIIQHVDTLQTSKQGRLLLSKIIPNLIEALKTKHKIKAYTILITMQGDCPIPDYDVWVSWWEKKGKREFAVVHESIFARNFSHYHLRTNI